MEPNTQHLKLWVEDLESGEHMQTTGAICADYGDSAEYCCLGRLCEVAMENGVHLDITSHPANAVTERPLCYRHYNGEGGSYVPMIVADWVGVSPGILQSYAAMNDGGQTFQQIASRIRKKYGI